MSVSIDIDTSNFDETMKNVNDKLRSLPYRIVSGGAQIVQPEMANRVPVRTGYLRSSIDSVISQYTSVTSTHTPYARFVDQGTRFFVGRFFIKKTVDATIGKIRKMIEDLLGEMRE